MTSLLPFWDEAQFCSPSTPLDTKRRFTEGPRGAGT